MAAAVLAEESGMNNLLNSTYSIPIVFYFHGTPQPEPPPGAGGWRELNLDLTIQNIFFNLE